MKCWKYTIELSCQNLPSSFMSKIKNISFHLVTLPRPLITPTSMWPARRYQCQYGTLLFLIFVEREEKPVSRPEVQRDVAQPHLLLFLLLPAQHRLQVGSTATQPETFYWHAENILWLIVIIITNNHITDWRWKAQAVVTVKTLCFAGGPALARPAAWTACTEWSCLTESVECETNTELADICWSGW